MKTNRSVWAAGSALFSVALVLGTAAMAGCSDPAPRAQREPATTPTPVPPTAATPVTPPVANAAPVAAAPSVVAPQATEAKPAKVVPPAPATRLGVKRLVLAHGVSGHEPVAPSDHFSVAEGSRIYAFVEVDNEEKAPGEVSVTFEPPSGKRTGEVMLAVGASPRWRTWAFTRSARELGEWTAVVRNRRGEVLARAPFEVTL